MQKPNDITARILSNQTGVAWVAEYRFHPIRKWRFDYACVQFKIAIEIEGGVWTGGRHTSGAGFMGDMEKYNEAVILGWSLLRFTPQQMNQSITYESIRQLIKFKNL